MNNNAYMNHYGAEVDTSASSSVLRSYEGYMNSQDGAEQIPHPVVSEIVSPVITPEPERVKPYTFRRLNSTDLFPMIKIISKIGLDELTQVFDIGFINKITNSFKKAEEFSENTSAAEEESQFIVGIGIALRVANKILEHVPSCEKEIFALLANVSGMSVEAVKALDLDIFMEMILDFVMKEEFSSFFKVASKYIRLEN